MVGAMRDLIVILLILTPALARGAPAFAANGATTVVGSTTTCTPSTTSLGTVGADDIILLVAQGEGDINGTPMTLSTANNFVAITGSPMSIDDNDALEETGEMDIGVWWVRGSSWTAAPVVADSGDHTNCALHRFTGAATSGNPWDVIGLRTNGTVDTSGTVTGASTTVADTLIVLIAGNTYNSTGTATCSAWTNANLSSLTERFDSTDTAGLGGGHCMATGIWSSTGAFGDTTLTFANTTTEVAYSIALKPASAPACSDHSTMGFFGCY